MLGRLSTFFTPGHHEHVTRQMRDGSQLILRLALQVSVCSCCHQAWGLKRGAPRPNWMWAISEWDQPLLWPSRTGVVHPVVTESACERNYSSFAPLGVRRRDPAYRSDSWTGWMVVLRDEPPSEDERDQCITAEPCEPCSVCGRLTTVTQKGFKLTVITGKKISVNAVIFCNNRHPRQSL